MAPQPTPAALDAGPSGAVVCAHLEAINCKQPDGCAKTIDGKQGKLTLFPLGCWLSATDRDAAAGCCARADAPKPCATLECP